MLFTLSRSLTQIDSHTLLALVNPDDIILLLQDGVNAALKHSYAMSQLLSTQAQIYVLQEDVNARGLLSFISDNVRLIDYAGFVKLTVQCYPQVAW